MVEGQTSVVVLIVAATVLCSVVNGRWLPVVNRSGPRWRLGARYDFMRQKPPSSGCFLVASPPPRLTNIITYLEFRDGGCLFFLFLVSPSFITAVLPSSGLSLFLRSPFYSPACRPRSSPTRPCLRAPVSPNWLVRMPAM